MSSMWWDISLQALTFLFGIFMFLHMNDIPRKYLTKYYAYRDRSKHQSRRHFVKAADLLSKSQSHPKSSPESLSYAAAAAAEADAAVRLFPSDAANHIVKALALDRQGFKTSALDAINAALSPLAAASLSGEERADALAKRAELRMEVSRIGGGDSDSVDESVWSVAEGELREAVGLRRESGRAWCLLGACCEGLGKREKAIEAFEEVLKIEPNSVAARNGLERLRGGDDS